MNKTEEILKLEQEADTLYLNKEYLEAKKKYQSLLLLDIAHTKALKRLGACLFFLQKYVQSLKCFIALQRSLNPEEVKGWIYACLVFLGKRKEAHKVLEGCGDIKKFLEQEGITLDFYYA